MTTHPNFTPFQNHTSALEQAYNQKRPHSYICADGRHFTYNHQDGPKQKFNSETTLPSYHQNGKAY